MVVMYINVYFYEVFFIYLVVINNRVKIDIFESVFNVFFEKK